MYEKNMISVIVLAISLFLFALAYRFYSPVIARKIGIEPGRPTPSHTLRDDVDYCPAKMPVLFGHHFASIAGAAPIVGPVIAAAYGWGPVVLWIIFGGIFLGAVHDFTSLVTSVHHDGHSMGEVIGRYLGRTGKRLFLFFLWATMVLLIAVFLDVAAKTFVAVPTAATSSMLFIALAVVFGLAIYRLQLSLVISTIVGVVLLALCIAAGWMWPLQLPLGIWMVILIAYIFIASVTPVWILLQPRDYLNSFLLYGLLIVAVVGIFIARPQGSFPVFITWIDPGLGAIFPILFVTVACGAISGYHSVVAGGTTAKQLNKESDARPIGYGGMLVESLLAVIAVITVMLLGRTEYGSMLAEGGPVAVFSNGIGVLMETFGVESVHGTTFAALAVSAFVLTTLDTSTRLARFAVQEFFERSSSARSRVSATLLTVGAAAALAFSGQWKAIWPLFGSANQLLAALALLAVSLWLKARNRKSTFVRIPMIIMFIITVSALCVIIGMNLLSGAIALAGIAFALLILTAVMLFKAVRMI